MVHGEKRNMEKLYRIGITHGDFNGVGYEVIMKTLTDSLILDNCTPVVYGLSKAANFYKEKLGLYDFSFHFCNILQQITNNKPNLLNLSEEEIIFELGKSTVDAGKMAELALKVAVEDFKNNQIDAIVTAPICKANIQSNSFNYQGHTEFFEAEFGDKKAMMLMVAEKLRIGFVTNHTPINEIAKKFTKELILRKLQTLNHSLLNDFNIINPKIAVLSLNPHAGDNGLLGKEEKLVIEPAVNEGNAKNMNVSGPFPADGFFGFGEYKKFDAVLAMYHDQGMLPFKLLAGENGVNFTAGLPVVRTSPAHGTAYNIAGKNIADATSMRNAIILANKILKNRNK